MAQFQLVIRFIDGSNREPINMKGNDWGKDSLAERPETYHLVESLRNGECRMREKDGEVIPVGVVITSPVSNMPSELEVGPPNMEDGPLAKESLYTVRDCPNPNCKAKKESVVKGRVISMHTQVQLQDCKKAREAADREVDTMMELDAQGGD